MMPPLRYGWLLPVLVLLALLPNGLSSVLPKIPNVSGVLKVVPESIELHGQRTCIPRWEQIEVTNVGDEEMLLEEVISDHTFVHPSMRPPEVLQGRGVGRTAIQILFLAQEVGDFSGFVIIRTNRGALAVPIKAVVTENEYGVAPIIASVLMGERYAPPIVLRNPSEDSDLSVREIFTTEPFLHLALAEVDGTAKQIDPREMAGLPNVPPAMFSPQLVHQNAIHMAPHPIGLTPPSGVIPLQTEGHPGMWRFKPLEQKTVIFLSFASAHPGKFRSFVHIKMDVENLLVPVLLSVVKGGIQLAPEIADFQTLVSPQQSRSVWLTLTNLNQNTIELLSLYDPMQDPYLTINSFDKSSKVGPGQQLRFARVSYRGVTEGLKLGKLQLITNDTNAVSAIIDVPFAARVLHGSLGFMHDKTRFQSTPGKITKTMRSVMISNNFSVPVLIHDAKIDDPAFKITSFEPVILVPGEAVVLLQVEFTSNGSSALYTRDLELTTNVSAMKVPLQVYHGKLHCQVDDGPLQECANTSLSLDLGTVSIDESRQKLLNLTNMNPVNVTIETIQVSHPGVKVFPEGVYPIRGGRHPRKQTRLPMNWEPKTAIAVPPFYRLALVIEVKPTEAGAVSNIEVLLTTRRKEVIALSLRYESVLGNLAFYPGALRFDASFPGRVEMKVLAARSTFERPLKIVAVRSNDTRIIPELLTPVLSPMSRKEILRVHFDPSKVVAAAAEPRYVEPPASHNEWDDTDFGNDDAADSSPSPETAGAAAGSFGDVVVQWDAPLTTEVIEKWQRSHQYWESMGYGEAELEAVLTFDTNIVQGATVPVRASLVRPVVTRQPELKFNLTQVGASVPQMLTVLNPLDSVLAVQLVFPQSNASGSGFGLPPEARRVFYVPQRSELLVGPILFEPLLHQDYHSTLYIRNNLTVFQALNLSGTGGSGRLVFKETSLDFNLTAADFEELEEEETLRLPTSSLSAVEATDGNCSPGDPGPPSRDQRYRNRRVWVSKSFVAINDCELPVEILQIDIDGVPGCSNFGFQIHQCEPFRVAPHENVSLTISFAPDFPASRWDQQLRLHTPSGVLALPLRAFVPAELLPKLAERAPFLGESEHSIRNLVSVAALVFWVTMAWVVGYDAYSAGFFSSEEAQEPSKASETLSVLTWAAVGSMALAGPVTPPLREPVEEAPTPPPVVEKKPAPSKQAQAQKAAQAQPPSQPATPHPQPQRQEQVAQSSHPAPAPPQPQPAPVEREKPVERERPQPPAEREKPHAVEREKQPQAERGKSDEPVNKGSSANDQASKKEAKAAGASAQQQGRSRVLSTGSEKEVPPPPRAKEQAAKAQAASQASATPKVGPAPAEKTAPPPSPAAVEAKSRPVPSVPIPKTEMPARPPPVPAPPPHLPPPQSPPEVASAKPPPLSGLSAANFLASPPSMPAPPPPTNWSTEAVPKEPPRDRRSEPPPGPPPERGAPPLLSNPPGISPPPSTVPPQRPQAKKKAQAPPPKRQEGPVPTPKGTAGPSGNFHQGQPPPAALPKRSPQSQNFVPPVPSMAPPAPSASLSPVPPSLSPSGPSLSPHIASPLPRDHEDLLNPLSTIPRDTREDLGGYRPPHPFYQLPREMPTPLQERALQESVVAALLANVKKATESPHASGILSTQPPPPRGPPPPAPSQQQQHQQQQQQQNFDFEMRAHSPMPLSPPPGLTLNHSMQPPASSSMPPIPWRWMRSKSGAEHSTAHDGPPSHSSGPPRPSSTTNATASQLRPSLLPDQEFVPLNTETLPGKDRISALGDAPITSWLFSSPSAMFGPVTSYGGDAPVSSTGSSGLLADLHADSQPVEHAAGRIRI